MLKATRHILHGDKVIARGQEILPETSIPEKGDKRPRFSRQTIETLLAEGKIERVPDPETKA
jgi:hypothetical protein